MSSTEFQPPRNLKELLDRLEAEATGRDHMTIDLMMEAVGRRSYGPVILLVGLVAMSPLSGIPTIPSVLGIIVALVASQILFGRTHFWLPSALLSRSISQDHFLRGIRTVRPVGRWIDRFTRPRLRILTRGPGASVILVLCVLFGVTMPPLEVLPFLSTTAGVALTVFGLALVADDGFLALLAYVVTGGMVYLVATNLSA